jgi:hypothetical protein
MRRLLLALALCCLLIASSVSAAESEPRSVATPSFRDGDWFEYEGWTAGVFSTLQDDYANQTEEFDHFSINNSQDLRILWLEGETISLGGDDKDCTVTQSNYWMNMSAEYTVGTTDYDNDTMTLNYSSTLKVWTPKNPSRLSKRVETILVESWFSGGGEDNHLEMETIRTEFIVSNAIWPTSFTVGESWSFTEEIDRNITVRHRTNSGLWNLTGYDQHLSRVVTLNASMEADVLTGPLLDEVWKTVVVEQQVVGEDEVQSNWYDQRGYLVKTERRSGEVLQLSAILVDHSYYAEETHDETVNSNWGLPAPTLLAGLGVMAAASLLAKGETKPELKKRDD